MPTITGTAGADTLTGTGEADLIDGSGGPDVIAGGGGPDTLRGGDGDDRIVFQLTTNPPTLVEGGAGVDILDFSAYDSSRFFFNQPLTIRGGTTPDSLSVSAFFFERGGAGTNAVVTEATGIERLILGQGITVDLSGTDIARRIESHLAIGQSIKGGSGNDVVSLTLLQDVTAAVGYNIDGGPGSDLLVLSGASTDRLIQQTADGWAIYHGPRGVSTFVNIEQVQISVGNAGTWQQAAAQDFDSAAYLANYADLRAAFGADEVKAFQHYQQYGKAEGRVATTFDGLSYIASHTDLIRALGADNLAGIAHYTQYGRAEGRAITFDGQAYAASHLDLARIIGTDTAAAARHYIIHGLGEGRATSGFDSTAYLLTNPDVAASLAFTPTSQVLNAARTHWLTYGADEGRAGDALFGRDQMNPRLASLGFDGPSLTNGQFEIAGDRDWFFADLPTRTQLTLNGSDAVSSIAVYDVRGRLIVFDDDGQDVRFAVPLETLTAAAGSVYIVATASGTGSYTLTVSRPAAQSNAANDDETGLANAANALAGEPWEQAIAVTAVSPDAWSPELHAVDPALQLLDF